LINAKNDYIASRGLSATAELLVFLNVRYSISVTVSVIGNDSAGGEN